MPKLDLRLEQLRTGAADPCHNRFTDLARLECIHQAVLVVAAELAKNHDELDVWDVLVAQAVIRQGAARKNISPNGNA